MPAWQAKAELNMCSLAKRQAGPQALLDASVCVAIRMAPFVGVRKQQEHLWRLSKQSLLNGYPVWCFHEDAALHLKGTKGKMAWTLSPMLYSKSDLSSLMPACSLPAGCQQGR